ncbi:glutathione S-transferase family protein [Limobrevibacterium gyesilva]|uniref:Glutathione S-transferase N-terminal domain-containing protein n=1 Tax=Limobrevibacterium gyesilva TaxID=2991712 RepID=A0AA42CGH8_9PROT|nr:glutathione S-transferase N-terminal domain-containing protein [Limobrevibacterium gyesilva]MCW3474017.1 glutathione S-transferase N-terminal domain-containing protein [Limobrevibacterium gyesilva]
MLSLYYYPGNASLFPHMLLRELGAAFELRLVDRTRDAQKSPEYLKLNPHGRIPVLVDGDLVLYETAAIALYLVDRHPEAGLAPPVGTPERAQFYKWMVHLTNTPQAEYHAWFYPHEHVLDPAAAATVQAAAGQRLNGMFDRIAGALGDGPFLLGRTFSAADLFLLMLLRWGRGMPRPPRTLPALGAFAERVLARPAVQATFAAEGLAAPLV